MHTKANPPNSPATGSASTDAEAAAAQKKEAAEAAAKNSKSKTTTTKVLFVRSRPDQFYRAGMKFTRDGVQLDPADLSEDAIKALLDEPMLIVEKRTVQVEQESV